MMRPIPSSAAAAPPIFMGLAKPVTVPEARRPWGWYGLALVVVILDQATKGLIRGSFQLHESLSVTDFFNLVFVYNPGASFSFLAGAGGWQRWLFSALALGVAGWIARMLWKEPGSRLYLAGLAFIMGGALGNVVDRIVLGAVVDFLDFHWGDAHFAAFNVADISINLGVGCLILQYLRESFHGRKDSA